MEIYSKHNVEVSTMLKRNCTIWGKFKGCRTIVRGMTLRIVECIMEFVYERYKDKKEKYKMNLKIRSIDFRIA